MENTIEFKNWLEHLECPKSYISDQVKQSLQKGVLGILWEDLPKNIRPAFEVSEARKNILLYKLKNESQDPLIQSIKNTVHLKQEREKVFTKIETLQNKCKNQELLCQKKMALLTKIKAERESLGTKNEILKIKHEQTLLEIKNCKQMQEICKQLMPPNEEEVSQSSITDCLIKVGNLDYESEKSKVWDKVSESLGSIKLPVLWNSILTARAKCTDYLIKLDIEENQNNRKEINLNIQTAMALLCSEYLSNVAKSFNYKKKIQNHEENTMEYVNKIEEIIETQGVDLNNWLPLALEIKKLEVWQVEILKIIEKLKDHLSISNATDDKLMQVINQIQDVDEKIAEYIHEINIAFGFLKSSESLILKKRDSLFFELEKIKLLKNPNNNWTNIDLNNELTMFANDIVPQDLRKIVIKSDSGTYKYLNTCFIKSAIMNFSIGNDSELNFPIVRIPICYLMDFYKKYMANTVLSKNIYEDYVNSEESSYYDERDPLTEIQLLNTNLPNNYNFDAMVEYINSIDLVCKRSNHHIEDFEEIFKIWSNQSIDDIVQVIFSDLQVNNSTLNEWKQRFAKMIYIFEKSNINVVK